MKAGEAFDPGHLTTLVNSHVAKAETLSTAGGEISFRLPREHSSDFPGLFRELEDGREAMGIGGYGVSITSLEEVFLSLEKEGKLADSGEFSREIGDVQDRIQDNGHIGASGGNTVVNSSSGGRRDRDGQLRQRRSSGRDSSVRKSVNGHGNGSVNGVTGKQPRIGAATAVATTTGEVREIEMRSMTTAAASPPTVEEDQHSAKTAQAASISSAVAITNNNNNTDVRERNHEARSGGRASMNGHANPNVSANGRLDQRFAHDEEDLAALLAEGQEEDSPLTLPPDLAKERNGERGMRDLGRTAAAAGVPGGNGGVVEGGAAGAGFWEQLCWLLWKRKVVAMRDWRGGLYKVVLPAVLVGLVLVLLTIDVGLAGPSLAMSGEMFGSTQVRVCLGFGRVGVRVGCRVGVDRAWVGR